MRIKTRRKRSGYKSEKTYIKAVFSSNKNKIMKNMAETWIRKGIKNKKMAEGMSEEEAQVISDAEIAAARKDSKFMYRQFYDLVDEKMKYKNPETKKNYTAFEAIKKLENSKDLNKNWTTGDVYSRNFYNLIKKDKSVKSQFFANEGLKTRVDYKKFEFLGYYIYKGKENAVYRYGDSYFLERKSPEEGTGASLTYMTGTTFEMYESTDKIAFNKWRKQ